MHTFYYPDHILHDPGQLHRLDTPYSIRYYSEVAQRGLILHDAIKTAELSSITTPADFGIEPISDVHDYGMLTVLQTAYHRTQREEAAPTAIPETFSVRMGQPRKPRSIWGLLGYYCFDTSSPIFEHTWNAAYWSAQTALSTAALVSAGGEQVAYALCRPPGHHVATDLFGGFCYLNNAAIAANWLVNQGQRVAILDIDYHHGNGTQTIFYGRSDVLFCSIHADPLYEYPYYWGFADEFGVGPGVNYNFNFPLPRGTGDDLYLQTLAEALAKIRLYVPDILLVSLGLDTAENDPAGGFKLQTPTFYTIGSKLGELNLPLVIIQEGGYLLPKLGENIVSFLRGVLGKASL